MKRTFWSLISILITLMFFQSKASNVSQPDFAYPKQVSADAEKQLDAALRANDGQMVVDALIKYGLAQNAISGDNFPAVVNRIEEVLAKETDPTTRALLNTLLARLYFSYYDSDSYDLDSRSTVDATTDFTLWSGQQFKDKIMSLLSDAMSDAEALKAAKIVDYPQIIITSELTPLFYPTLYDFVASQSVTLLSGIASPIIRFLPLSRIFYTGYSHVPLPNMMPKIDAMAINTLDAWVDANRGTEAPFIEALCQRVNYLSGYVADSAGLFTALLNTYDQYALNPYAIEILIQGDATPNNEKETKALYDILTKFRDEHPDYLRIAAVNNMIGDLETKRILLKIPAQVAKGHQFTVEVESRNVKETKVTVYRVKDSAIDHRVKPEDLIPNPYAVYPVSLTGEVPFNAKASVGITINDYGRYVIKTDDRAPEKYDTYDVTVCSDITLIDNQMTTDMTVWAVNSVTGAPLKDVRLDILYNEGGRQKAQRDTGFTAADGSYRLKAKEGTWDIKGSQGSDLYGVGVSQWVYIPEQREQHTAFIHTDLAIYHPGDSVGFVAVLYKYLGKNRTLLPDTDCEVIARDANHQPIDTLKLRTDAFGRVSGTVKLPQEGLTGIYTLFVRTGGRYLGNETFTVSDYKLPTYEVVMDELEACDDGSLIVKGRALTYSGFPVADATVNASLISEEGSWWFRSQSVQFDEIDTTTDADGRFALTLTAATLANAPFPNGLLKVDMLVTSSTGETHSASRSIRLSDPYNLHAAIDTNCIMAVTGAKLQIAVTDRVGHDVDTPVSLTFKSADKEYFFEGKTVKGTVTLDLSSLPSATYSLLIETAELDTDPEVLNEVIVYRPGDKNCPAEEPLWLPKSVVRVAATENVAKITYATDAESLHLLATIYDENKIISHEWLKPKRGINTLAVNIPDGVKRLNVLLRAVKDIEEHYKNVEINVDDPESQLKVTVEHMRDRVTPLTDETVTISVTDGSGKGLHSALILDMYSKALDAIASNSWTFSPARGSLPYLRSDDNFLDPVIFTYSTDNNRLHIPQISAPVFNFYGRDFMRYLIYDNMVLRYDAGGVESCLKAESAEPIASNYFADKKTVGYSDVDVDYDEIPSEAETEAEANSQKSENQYRPSEVPLAFFAPKLTTNSDGRLTYSFTVPNANTTWVFNALAYNELLKADLAQLEVVASKPVMVEPNLPRFIRRGDSAVILASVMNSTDSVASVVTTFEILNPADMSVVATQSAESVIDAGASATVSFKLDADNGLSTMLIRVKSTAGNYTDGVQTLLPVLSDAQPVIESHTFYLQPSEKHFEEAIPAATDATTTLSFCENPTWEVVSALPGLRASSSGSSLSASAVIFSAATARYIMNLNPLVEKQLREWLSSSRDEQTMLSMLNRNEDLKQLVLSSTPWVEEAQSDEERITRLALLFDRGEINDAIRQGVATLKKLQCSDGGWAWTSHYMKSSEWVTLAILNNFAELRQLGCCPAELDKMIAKAVAYIDNEVAKEYKKYPKSDYSYYTYVRSLYPEVKKSAEAANVIDTTLATMAKDWKKYSTIRKATTAMTLYRNGYKSVVPQILASLREYASESPQQGMWWDSLDSSTWWSLFRTGQTAYLLETFNMIDPGCPEVDKIRQWLILNKTVQDWGTSVNASACVAAILGCGSDWLSKPGDVTISVGGKRVEPSSVDKLTGSFVVDIPQAEGQLVIDRTADNPAWGAVINRFTQSMDSIAAASIPELSVTKQILVKRGDSWVDTDSLAVGDVAKIRLIINSMRDMDYVTVVDNRAACMEPVIQTPRPVYCDGIVFYLENRDDRTNLFVNRLYKGQFILEYEMYVNNSGRFSSGVATIQSQYRPEMTAHSAGCALTVSPQQR